MAGLTSRCYICGLPTKEGEYRIDICNDCADSEPALSTGLRLFEELHFTTELEPLITGISWFDFRKLSSRHNGRVYQREPVPQIEVEQAVEDLSQQFSQLGRKHALTFLHIYDAMTEMWAQNDYMGTDAGLPSETTKLGVGLAISSHISTKEGGSLLQYYPDPFEIFGEKPPNPVTADQIYGEELFSLIDSLGLMFRAYNQMENDEEDYNPLKDLDRVRASVRRAQIAGSPHVDSTQSVDIMNRLYSLFKLAFLEELGFDFRNAREWANQLLDFFYQRRKMLFQHLRWYHADCLRAIGSYGQHRDIMDPEEFIGTPICRERIRAEKLAWVHVIDAAEKLLWFDRDAFRRWAGIKNQKRFNSFMDRISVSPGEMKFRDLFDDLNPLDKHPLVECGGQFLVPIPAHFGTALMNTFYHDLFDLSNSIRGEWDQKWGDVMEFWAGDSIQKIFSGGTVFLQTNIHGDLETDALARYNDTLMVFEVKSKQLTKEALEGEPEALKQDFSLGIGEAASQLRERIDVLKNAESDDVLEEGIELDLGSIDHYLPVVVMSATYQSLATHDYVRLINEDPIPYVVGAHHLEIISQVANGPDWFIKYVKGRIEANKKGLFISGDELDYLGYYLHKGHLRPTFQEVEDIADREDIELFNSIVGFSDAVEERINQSSEIYLKWLE